MGYSIEPGSSDESGSPTHAGWLGAPLSLTMRTSVEARRTQLSKEESDGIYSIEPGS